MCTKDSTSSSMHESWHWSSVYFAAWYVTNICTGARHLTAVATAVDEAVSEQTRSTVVCMALGVRPTDP